MKIFKRIALLVTVLACMICAGVFASACGDKEATEFTVTVYYSDGTTVVNGETKPLKVQICDESGMFCYAEFFSVDANGQAKINIAKVNEAADKAKVNEKTYVLHVLDANFSQLEIKEEVKVNASNPNAKLVLKTVAA